MRQAYDDYVERNWKPGIKRRCLATGCFCPSCQLHRQLRREWDKNQEQAAEFQRYLQEKEHEESPHNDKQHE